jgi:acetyl-CoA carboxylase biotin carboxylase subunit
VFHRLLIANRGEVAARIARTARSLGISPVGVASSADLDGSWLGLMDEVVCLGPAAARESYLAADKLVQAALQTRCTALHPGWGFLSENPRFAALVEQHGVTFVGPSPRAIASMGKKSPAKAAAKAAGLEVVPGSDGALRDVAHARELARAAGYPVLLKADAGGGGRGMRRCDGEAELERAYLSAQAEAESAFGSGLLYLEKYLEAGRHIEVQLMGDGFGDAVHLFERECSIQRRHQKLIEETPSPVLDDAERRALGERAAAAARRMGYRNAGTIEFLRDARSGKLYFMEMNTRLQVEHPISEALLGLDIVKLQLEVAANRRLPLQQAELVPRGHAIECRINAEDPSQDFRPSPGRLEQFEFRREVPGCSVRIDTHLVAGDSVSPHYDSLLAKVIVHAPDRARAIAGMRACLSGARVTGVHTTIPLHLAVLDSPEFQSGRYDTGSLPGWSPAAQRR